MKKIVAVFCISILFFNSCKESLNDIGLNILPENDKITAKADTFHINSSTEKVKSVLVSNRMRIYMLGKYQNEILDVTTNGSLLAQVTYPQQNLRFETSAVIDSMVLEVNVAAIFNAENVSFNIYELKKQLQFRHNYFTDINDDEYVDFGSQLGSITLSEVALDTINKRIERDTTHNFRIKLSDAFAQRFKDESIYADANTFKKAIKGIYVQATSGNTILYSNLLELQLYYRYPANEEMKSRTLIFPANNEVRQVNRVEHTGLEAALDNKPENREYVYAPAGFFTTIDIPLKTIVETTASEGKRIGLNAARLTIAVDKRDTIVPMPRYLLLIKKDKMQAFFEENKLPERNSESSFVGMLSSSDSTYTFDLTYFTQKAINSAELEEEIVQMVIVPVNITLSSSGAYASVSNLMELSGFRATRQRFTVVYNEFFDPRN